MEQPRNNKPDRPKGMRPSEIAVLCDLLKAHGLRNVLEIGMANGSSTVAMLSTLNDMGGGHVTSIDPFQFADVGSIGNDNDDGYSGEGVDNVNRAGYAHMHTMIAEPDYVALPKLVERGEKYDFIFIDGYHSFDYTMLDFFYADLLLQTDGMLAIHDSGYKTVYKVCQFITHNKPYSVVGPPSEMVYGSLPRKAARRIKYLVKGQNRVFDERRLKWASLAAFQKHADKQCPQYVLEGL